MNALIPDNEKEKRKSDNGNNIRENYEVIERVKIWKKLKKGIFEKIILPDIWRKNILGNP